MMFRCECGRDHAISIKVIPVDTCPLPPIQKISPTACLDLANKLKQWKGRVMSFDYDNAHNGPKLRAGKLLDVHMSAHRAPYITLTDWTVNDEIRHFSVSGMSNISVI